MKFFYTTVKKYKVIFIFVFILGCSGTIYAQGFGLPGFDDNVDDEEVPAAPINGFIGLALVAGGCLGVTKLKKIAS